MLQCLSALCLVVIALAEEDDAAVRASPPKHVSATRPSEEGFQVAWEAGESSGPCQFAAWHIELRKRRPKVGEWMAQPNCTQHNKQSTKCDVQGLEKNTEFDVRVLETCLDSSHNSRPTLLEQPFWTLPGEWWQHVGQSKKPSTIVSLGSSAQHCRVVKQCCPDEFGVCFDVGSSEVTVMRYDVAGGWGQDLKLRCHAHVVAPWAPSSLDLVQASPPSMLEVEETTSTSLTFKYKLGGMGDCACAKLEVQLKAGGSGAWNPLSEDACGDVLARQCRLEDLLPNTLYQLRLRMKCPSDNALHSNFTLAKPRATKPGCAWTGTSGLDNQIECADGSHCEAQPTNERCCSGRGGRYRCPRNLPIMCKGLQCADGTDHCCAVDVKGCSSFGGVRQCTIPALAPVIVSVQAKSKDSLVLQWKPQEYLEGSSGCAFVQWHAEVALVNSHGGLEDWRLGCAAKDYRATFCTIDGLLPSNAYVVRLTSACQDSAFNSEPVMYPHQVWTNGVQAEPPLGFGLVNLSWSGFTMVWRLGIQNDCVFKAWEVEGIRPDQPRKKDDPWLRLCTIDQWNITQCAVTDAPSKSIYQVRVRESCIDEETSSNYAVLKELVKVKRVPIRAAPAWNVSLSGVSPYSARISWQPGRAGDCEFRAWQVYVWLAGEIGSPAQPHFGSLSRAEAESASAGSCRVQEDRYRPACLVSGLHSKTRYTAFVREECESDVTYSPFVAALPGWTLPAPAGTPQLLNATVLSQQQLYIHWQPGDPGDCNFRSWKLFVMESTGSWAPFQGSCAPHQHTKSALVKEVPGNALRHREATVCMLHGLESSTDYAVRLREACTDERANSPFATWSARTLDSSGLVEYDDPGFAVDVDAVVEEFVSRKTHLSASRDFLSAGFGACAAFTAMSCSRLWALPRRWWRRHWMPRDT